MRSQVLQWSISSSLARSFYLFNIRTDASAFSSASFTNKKAFLIILLMIVLQLGLTYLPFMQDAFSTTGMQLGEWILTILCGFSILVITELEKVFFHKKKALRLKA